MEMWIIQSKPTGKYLVVLDTLQIILFPFPPSPAESFGYKTPHEQQHPFWMSLTRSLIG